MCYEELCEKYKPFLIKMSNYYGEAVGSRYPYVDKDDFYSIGLEAIQKKMDLYSKEKSNGKSYDNYMFTQIKYAMGTYADSITKKGKREGETRIFPLKNEDTGIEFGYIDCYCNNNNMNNFIANSDVTIDSILKTLDPRAKYIVEQVVLYDRPMRELAEELGITITYVSLLYNSALTKTKQYLNKIDYMETEEK